MDYFDTVITIVGYESTKEEFDAVADDILSQFEEYHKLYSIYHRFDGMENLCTVNELVDGVHRTVTVDKRIIDMLLYAKEMYTVTDGMVNVAMGSVLSLWHTYRELGQDNPAEATLPPLESLYAAAEHTDISKMIVDTENCTVTLTDPLMKLDVGAIAKGYATECVARSLEERGITGYILNIGGNIRGIGSKPDGTPWQIGVENPIGEDYLAYLQLNDESVVTSGSYQRYYYVDGKAYHHIIHPDTQMPAEGFLSVSVICKDSGFGDAMSTALFCLPKEDGLALVESISDLEAMWVTEDGAKTVSSGWNEFVKNKEDNTMLENILAHYKEALYILAEISASTLELVGILIIIIGSFRALVRLFKSVVKKHPFHVVVDLGKALSLALEFKMGAEIIKTVIIHNLEELAILGVVIVIRALLAFIIHWEIRAEEKEKKDIDKTET